MGMFDYVTVEVSCPKCGAKVTEFQSKSGPRCLNMLNWWEIDHFYGSCPKCSCCITVEMNDLGRELARELKAEYHRRRAEVLDLNRHYEVVCE